MTNEGRTKDGNENGELDDEGFLKDQPDDGAADDANPLGKTSKKRALMIGAAAAALLALAIGSVVAVVNSDKDATGTASKSPSIEMPALPDLPNAGGPDAKLSGIDLSACAIEKIVIAENGWVGFPAECVKLIAAEDMPDLP